MPLFLLSAVCSSPINAKKVNTLNSSDSYIGLWRNYLILCCSSASSSSMSSSSSTSGSVRCSPPETLASTPDSGYSYDSKVRNCSVSHLTHATSVICHGILTIASCWICLYTDCWHSISLISFQTHCSYDALWEHGHHRVSGAGAWQDQPHRLQVHS